MTQTPSFSGEKQVTPDANHLNRAIKAPDFSVREDGERLAYHISAGVGPGLLWCGGLGSDMEGSKATALGTWAKDERRPYTRFDYFGHGSSSGAFINGSMSRWIEDTLYALDTLTTGPQILVGSSMGAWCAIKAALARPKRVAALLLISPAPDFTQKLMWPNLPEAAQQQIMDTGVFALPNEYGEPLEITKLLIEDGEDHLIMDQPIPFQGPVHILQGMRDTSVPWQHARKLVDLFDSEKLVFTLVKDGDHSLSKPTDLTRMRHAAERLCTRLEMSAYDA